MDYTFYERMFIMDYAYINKEGETFDKKSKRYPNRAKQ